MELKYDKWMPVKIWIIAIILLIAVHPVKAESGTITVARSPVETISVAGGLPNAANMSNIIVDTVNFNTYGELDMSATGWTSTKPSNFTTFTWRSIDTTGAIDLTAPSGTGMFAYARSTGSGAAAINMSWTFIETSPIAFAGIYHPTQNFINITYSDWSVVTQITDPILNSIDSGTLNNGGCIYPACSYPAMSLGAYWGGAFVTRMVNGHYTNYLGLLVTNNYNVTYPMPGKFQVLIDKSGQSIVTSVSVNSTVGMYVADNVASITNLSFLGTQLAGIFINMTLPTGGYTNVTVNSSGCPNNNCIVTAPSVANATNIYVGGSPSGQIYFDTNQNYYFGQFGVNLSLNDANYTVNVLGIPTYPWRYVMYIYKPDGSQVAGSPLFINNMPLDANNRRVFSTGKNWAFSFTGMWNATVIACSVVDPACSVGNGQFTPVISFIIDTAQDFISLYPLSYSVTTDSSSYSTGQTIHVNVSNPSSNIVYLNIFDPLGYSTTTFATNVGVLPNDNNHPFRYFNYSIPSTVLKGKYTVVLGTIPTGGGGAVPGGITTFTIGTATPGSDILSIAWDSVDYVGGQNVLSWTANRNDSVVNVSKFVFGNYTVVDNFSVKYNDSNSQSYLLDVPGLWVAKITDNKSNVAYSNLTVKQGNAVGRCEKTAPDYVCWDNASYTRPANFVINFKGTNLPGTVVFDHITVSSPIFMVVYDPDGIMQGNTTIASVTGIYPFPVTNFWTGHFSTTAKTGIWTVRMIAGGTSDNQFNDGTVIVQGTTIVIDVPAPGTTVNAGAQGAVGTPLGTIDAWTAMFGMGVNDTSRFLFAIVLIIIFILLGFIMTGNNATGGIIVGFVPYAFFTYINYVPRWFIVVAVIIMAIKLRWF